MGIDVDIRVFTEPTDELLMRLRELRHPGVFRIEALDKATNISAVDHGRTSILRRNLSTRIMARD